MWKPRVFAVTIALGCLFAPAYSHATVSVGSDGWTVITPSSDTKTIYISSSSGNDSNTCLVQASPCKTIAKGVSLLRSGFPDWLLLKKGDTWTNEAFGTISKNGRSATEPMLIGAYGSGARPKIEASAVAAKAVNMISTNSLSSNSTGHYIAVVGLEFYCFDRNPADARFNLVSVAIEPTAINWANGSSWSLFEDNKISSFSGAMNLQPYDGVNQLVATIKHLDLRVRRNLILDNYGLFSNGVFLDGFEAAELTENLFDQNGYNESIAGQTLFDHRNDFATNHGLYINGNFGNVGYINGPVKMTGNMYMRDIRGAHYRSGGVADNNLFVHNTAIFDFGRPRPGVSYSITNNVFLELIDIVGINPIGSSAGSAITFFDNYNGFPTNFGAGSASATGNIFANTKATNYNGYAFAVVGGGTVSITGNIMYEWNFGPGDAQHGPLKLDAATGSVTSIPNEIYLSAQATYNTVSPSKYPDPTRSVGTYAATLGLPGTLDGFLQAARGQSKDTWDTRLSTNAVNNYVRAGFGAGSSTPPPPDTSAPSVPTSLNVNAASTSQANLIWNASSDNVGVTGYNVFRNNTKIASVTTTSYQDRAYTSGVNYSVSAYDAAGNTSAKSAVVTAVFNAGQALPPVSAGSGSTSSSTTSPSSPTPTGGSSAPITNSTNTQTPGSPTSPTTPIASSGTTAAPVNPTSRPSIKLHSPSNGLLIKNNGGINIAAQGTGQSITLTADGQVIEVCSRTTVCSATWPGKNIGRGTHIIRAIATDANGVQSADSALIISLK